jgi:RluA family pseudouridine synthase
MSTQYKWRVKRSEHGMSLENYIYKQLGDWSHKQVKDAIDKKRAFVNGKNVFISKWNVKRNDLVLFVPSQADLPSSKASASRYKYVDILYKDQYILLGNKPAFVDHEDFAATIQEFLTRQNKGKGRAYVGQMHRLDKETSGVMIFTLKKIANSLADQFREHTIRKFYLAVVEGAVKKDEGVIRKAIEKGRFDEGQKVRIAEDEAEGKRAETVWRIVERYENASLLRVEIKTGRTHQIRIHMNDAGYPLVGDKVYGKEGGIPFRRQALHAERLEFTHPISKQKMKVVAPLPKDMGEIIDKLRGI